jgi:hypothetical protein
MAAPIAESPLRSAAARVAPAKQPEAVPGRETPLMAVPGRDAPLMAVPGQDPPIDGSAPREAGRARLECGRMKEPRCSSGIDPVAAFIWGVSTYLCLSYCFGLLQSFPPWG